MLPPRPAIMLICALPIASPASADVFYRWNQAGFSPQQPKSIVAMSDTDLAGLEWSIRSGDWAGMRGDFGPSVTGAGDHSPFLFNHVVKFGTLSDLGDYEFLADGKPVAQFRIEASPYRRLLSLPLRHLRAMRSGSHETVLREFSHPGDARAPMFVPDGDPANGKWKPAAPARTIDALGGWYDAGDQIKFTLCEAATVYHLLHAYRLKPEYFGTELSRSGLPDVLDEARHGLEFLMRTFPDDGTFIIQVGNAEDHEQGSRLPEHDKLDGKRPALCALSRAHMGATAAALALGARTFGDLGRTEDAERYGTKARAIFGRALEPDTIATAFERDDVNDFYRDPDPTDQMALAAAELHALTGVESYLTKALELAPPPAEEVGWANWNWLANLALAPHDNASKRRLIDETTIYVRRSLQSGAPWGISSRYVWGSLPRWIGNANACLQAACIEEASPQRQELFWDVVNYTFGQNNWGVSFLFSEDIPNTLRNLYSPAYKLLGKFPTGALSEGPGRRALHDSLSKYFTIPADDPFHRFNTPAAVFFDNSTDFMCQEATISAQADLVLMLTLATLWEEER